MTQLMSSHDGFWGWPLASLETISLDILHLIAEHSAVRDLVTLRTVSKPLQTLLSDPDFWRKWYRKSLYHLPPGPYGWQSASHLITILLRAESLYSVWPSSSSCPEILRTRSLDLGCDADFCVLLGRWILVAEGPTLVCYDSQCSRFPKSVDTLFDDGAERRIFQVFSVGVEREDDSQVFAVLVFEHSFIITRILMDRGQPSSLQTIFTSMPITVERWTDLVHVRLYHRLLVLSIGECSLDLDSPERLIIMDIDTLRQYCIPPATDDEALDPMYTRTFFFSTKTHLVKVMNSTPSGSYKVLFKVECFPIPTSHAPPDSKSDVLYPSHQSRVIYGPQLCDCVVVHESPIDSETGRMSFTLLGLNMLKRGGMLEIIEFHLERDGSISFVVFRLTGYLLTSFCIGLNGQHGCGVALRANKRLLAFALDCLGPGSFSFKYSMLDHDFGGSDLFALDAFRGIAFFPRQAGAGRHVSIQVVDFARDAQRMGGRVAQCVLDRDSRLFCACGECYLSD